MVNLADPTHHDYDEAPRDGSTLAGLPAWVRAVAIIGVPSAIALFLVWMGATEIPRIRQIAEANRVNDEQILRNQAAILSSEEQLLRVTQRVCSQTARTDDERTRCFDK